MAASADDILTTAELKTHLRLPQTHTSEDEFLADLISQSIDIAARDTGLPLLDYAHTAFADWPFSDEYPLEICKRHFRFDNKAGSGDEIDYWTDQADLTGPPDGSINETEITRIARSIDGRTALLYAKDGWPADRAPRTRVRVKGTVGVDASKQIKGAVIVLTRLLYDAPHQIPDRSAYDRLIGPLIQRRPAD